MKSPMLAVVIATKNRAEAIQKYALPSLERSVFRDFACVVWDASDDDATRQAVENGAWNFTLRYSKAPRVGSSSQRNDAVDYVLDKWRVKYMVFIDDDSELSPDALGGVAEGFLQDDVWGINIPIQAAGGGHWLSRLLNVKDRVVITPFLYNLPAGMEDRPGAPIEWIVGAGMAFRAEIFKDYRLKFPEPFELFGGYALGEDFALSFFVHKKLQKKLINSPKGHFVHYAHGGGRPDAKRMMAARWYNMHLLFEALYGDVSLPRYLLCKFLFKSVFFMSLSKKMLSLRSLDPFRGYLEARGALKLGRKIFDINGDPRNLK